MTRRWRTVVGAGLCGALLVGACSGGQSGGEVTTNEPEPPDSWDPWACLVAEDCRERILADLRRLTEVPELVESGGGECEAFTVGGDPRRETRTVTVCDCHFAELDRSIGLAEDGLGCFFRSRDGGCLLSNEDYSGCDPSDDASCDAPCALFAERRNAEAAAEVRTEIVALECGARNCRSVVALNGVCYVLVHGILGEAAYDCSLEPSEIFARYDDYLEELDTPPAPRGTR